MSQISNVSMSLANFCAAKLSPQNTSGGRSNFNITGYCRSQSQIRSLDQKNLNNINTRFNTSYNDTSISKAMRYSHIARNRKGKVILLDNTLNKIYPGNSCIKTF
jgi:hypothetical protein